MHDERLRGVTEKSHYGQFKKSTQAIADKRSCEYLKMGYMKKGQKPSNTCKSPTIKNQLDQACN